VCAMSMLIDFDAKGKTTMYHSRKCYSALLRQTKLNSDTF